MAYNLYNKNLDWKVNPYILEKKTTTTNKQKKTKQKNNNKKTILIASVKKVSS